MLTFIILTYLVGSYFTLGYIVTHFKEVKVEADIDSILYFILALIGSVFWIFLLLYVVVSAVVFKLTFGRYTE